MPEDARRARLSTGNEYISIPDITVATAGVEAVGFIHRAFRACIELHGSEEEPLLRPIVEVDGEQVHERSAGAELESYWIPQFTMRTEKASASACVFAPLERRGFVYLLTVENRSVGSVRVKAGWKGCWRSTYHTASLSKLMAGTKYGGPSSWCADVPVIEFRGNTPLFAMALVAPDTEPARMWSASTTTDSPGWNPEGVSTPGATPIYYELTDEFVLEPGHTKMMPLYLGFGLEEVSAVSSARNLQLHGWERLLSNLRTWLEKHTIQADDPRLKQVMNVNSFYNYFFAQATALDSEELVVTSARSSRNLSCAAYRDRDAARWSLPAVLQIDATQARSMLIYAFTTQLANVGQRSRFVDGLVLEPGLQLDQLCAPIRALHTYVQSTDDMSVLFDRRVQAGINTVQQILGVQRHPDVPLFETLLLPSGEPSRYPYVCYSNVLAWRSLLDIGWLYDRIRDLDRTDEAMALANEVKAAVVSHFVVPGPYGDMFAMAVDLDGNFELGDDPEGSLQLLSFVGFCMPNDPVYRATVQWIHSEHNTARTSSTTAAEQGGVALSLPGLISELLTDRKDQALRFLQGADLDDGLACGIVDAETGRALTGMASASCAGYLAYAMRLALNALPPQSAGARPQRSASETLYEPPPEPSQNSKKARL